MQWVPAPDVTAARRFGGIGGGGTRRKARNAPQPAVCARLPARSLLRALSSFPHLFAARVPLLFSAPFAPLPHLLLFCLYPSIHLSSAFLLFFLHPLDFLGGSRGRGGKVPMGIGRPLLSHLAQPGLGPGRGRTLAHHLDSNQFTQSTFSLQSENNVEAHLKKNKQRIFSFFSYLLFTRYGCYKYNNGFTFHNGFS